MVIDYNKLSSNLQYIKKFNDKLNKFNYGILVNDEVITENIDWSQYKTIPIHKFATKKVGVCWDFVNYQALWFDNNGYSIDTYFLECVTDDRYDTHTFNIIHVDGYHIYFESSWSKHKGLYISDKKNDAFHSAYDRFKEQYATKKKDKISCYKYHTKGLDNNLSASEFISRVKETGKKISV